MILIIPFGTVSHPRAKAAVAMLIRIQDILETTKTLTYDEATDGLNPLLIKGAVHDYEFVGPATVQLNYYRAGVDLLFDGAASGTVSGQCARCLETYTFELDVPFRFLYVPTAQRMVGVKGEDPDLGYYHGQEVDLGPPVRERLILALPTQPLCRESCEGLCPRCGVNRNADHCACASGDGDARLAVLRNLRVGS